jgi:hypothetical protein
MVAFYIGFRFSKFEIRTKLQSYDFVSQIVGGPDMHDLCGKGVCGAMFGWVV